MRRPVLYALGVLLVVVAAVVVASVWARTPERDVRCDDARKAEATRMGQEYSCLVDIPFHDRGH